MKRMIAFILLFAALTGCFPGLCEELRVFILCDPKTPVNVRGWPNTGNEAIGRLDFGDSFLTDGEMRNGFIHVIGITEKGEGWVHAGYVVGDEPEKAEGCVATVAATGRVKCYLRIGSKKYRWLSVGTEVVVYALSEEWAVTNKGYVRTEYLEVRYE